MNNYPAAVRNTLTFAILALAIASFSPISAVFAIGLPTQTTDNAQTSPDTYQTFVQDLGTGISGSYSGITINGSFPSGVRLYLCGFSSTGEGENYAGCQNEPGGFGNYTWAYTTSTPATGITTIDLGSSYTFNSSLYYFLYWNDAGHDGQVNGSTNAGDYPNGGFYGIPGTGTGYNNGVNQAWFDFGTYTPPLTNSLSLDFPANYSTTTDFSNWGFTYSMATSSQGYIRIYYGRQGSATSSFYSDIGNLYTATGTFSLPKLAAFSYGSWEAYSELGNGYTDGTGYHTFVSTTTPVTYFSIEYGTTTSGSPAPPPLNPNASSTWSASCSLYDYPCQFEAWLAANAVNIIEAPFVYLFEPSSESLNQFGSLAGNIKNKVPFGYLPEIAGAFNNLTASGTPIATTTDLSPLASMISPVDDLLAALMTFLFAWWLFRRINYIEL